jgi:hypothetical protein
MNREEIIKLLKSGDFTIAYNDNESPLIYKGRHSYDYLPDENIDPDEYTFGVGYAPGIVELLVEALGGNIDSI